MSTQPKALRLADAIKTHKHHPQFNLMETAAAELRRLHEDCENWKQGYALLFKENGDRRRLNEELVTELRKARAALKEQLEILIQSHTCPTTGLITDDTDLLAIESDQDLINSIDAALAKAETP
jgi:hypothetical protein